MTKLALRVSIALALLTAASPCLAQVPPATPAAPAAPTGGGQPGQASLGGGAGLSYFLADGDYTMSRDGRGKGRDVWGTRDAGTRFAFAGSFRYIRSRRWRWQVSPGFLWTGYKELAPAPFKTAYFPTDSLKGKWLSLMMPISFQLQFLQRGKTWILHEGVGPGLYRVWVEQDRHVVKDPVTHRLHRGFYPGASAEIGAERFLKSLPMVSLEWTVASHIVLSQRDEQFPSGFNSNVWALEARMGANYHFDPRAIRKKK